MEKIPKIFLRDIAKSLVFVSGLSTDFEALEDTDDILSHEEKKIIIEELQRFCLKGLSDISKKYGDIPWTSTRDIVLQIAYESE